MNNKIRRNLIKLRTQRNWLQIEVARRAKVNHSLISYIESGKRQPSVRTLEKLADVFGVTMDELCA